MDTTLKQCLFRSLVESNLQNLDHPRKVNNTNNNNQVLYSNINVNNWRMESKMSHFNMNNAGEQTLGHILLNYRFTIQIKIQN